MAVQRKPFMSQPVRPALLFDLGNVVIDVDFDLAFNAWAQGSNTSVDLLRQRFSQDDAYARHERGEIDFSEYGQHLRDHLGLNLRDDELRDGWNAIYVGERAGMNDLLRRCATSLQTCAFTNTNATHQQAWTEGYQDILSHFSEIYVSCEMGLRKPEKAAFDAVVDRMGCQPADVLFFDDLEENIRGAREAGLQAVLVHSIDDVTQAVAPLLEE